MESTLPPPLMPGGGTQKNSGRVIFLENISDELQREVPSGDN
jgi:hypothetical protein